MDAISARNVSFSYQHEVLQNVTCTIREGDFVAIIGPNGSGKTTFAKLMLGLLKAQKGSLQVFGKEPSPSSGVMSYVPQHVNIDANFPATVDEITALHNPVERRHLFSRLGITFGHKKFNELSGGQQQRVLLALALLNKPKILVFDEPEAGIDAKGQEAFYAMLTKLHEEGTTIVVITHDLGVVSKHVHTVLCLNKTVCYYGKPGPKAIQSLYGGGFAHVDHHH